jgi:hypothetical protein
MRQRIGMKSGILCLLALLAVVSMITIGCGGSSSSSSGGFSGDDTNPSQTYSVSGMCTEANGTTALPGATVSCTDSGARSGVRSFSSSTTSDSNGQYSLFGIPAGNYRITITADGHVPTVIFLTVAADVTKNLFSISTSSWNSFAGADHPYNASNGYMLVNTFTVDSLGVVTKLAGVRVATSPTGTVGYVTSNVVNYSATSTSADGQAFVYSLDPAALYTITGSSDAYTFAPVSNALVSAGALYVYDLVASSQAATLQNIIISPNTASVPVGLSKQFLAFGVYSDGSQADITTRCTWTSANTALGTIGNGDAAGAKGLFTAVSPGSVNITATLGTISGTTSVTVSTSALQTVTVSPGTAYAANRAPQNVLQFHATGTWTDGTTLDVTNLAQWNTTNPSVAGVGSIDPATGKFTAQTVGTIEVYCVYKGMNSTQNALVTVGTKLVTSMTVSPIAKTVPYGFIQDFNANATYDDGSSGDVTLFATWTTSNPAVGTMAIGTSTAQFTTTGPGTCQVTASLFENMQASASVTVLALLDLVVDPPGVLMSSSDSIQISAWATYEGTSERYDITRRVNWTCTGNCEHGSPVGEVKADTGYFTAKCTGTSDVTCTLPGTTLTGTCNVTVLWGEIEADYKNFIENLGTGSNPKVAVDSDLYNTEYFKTHYNPPLSTGTIKTVAVSFTTAGSPGSTSVAYALRDVVKNAQGNWDYTWVAAETVAPGMASALTCVTRDDQGAVTVDPYTIDYVTTTTPVLAYQDLGKVKARRWGTYNADGTFNPHFGPPTELAGFDPSIATDPMNTSLFGIAFELDSIIQYFYGGTVTSTLITGSVASIAYDPTGMAMFTCELGPTPESRQLKFHKGDGTNAVIETTSGYRSSLALSPDGTTIGVAYESSDGATRTIKYRQSTNGGVTWTGPTDMLNISTGGWTSPQTVPRAFIDNGITPVLAFSSDGRPSITYASGQGTVRYAFKDTAGIWHVNTCPFGTIDGYPSTAGVCEGPNHKMAAMKTHLPDEIGPAVVYVKDGNIVFQRRFTAPDLQQ